MKTFIILLSFFVLLINSFAQENTLNSNFYEFEDIISLPVTPVKNQANTGTCWNFSTISFLESELIRMGKGEFDLSEMFVVRNIYPIKARKFIMRWGNQNFYKGGQAHDVMQVISTKGIVPDHIYSGLTSDQTTHDHREMDAVLKTFISTINKKEAGELSTHWEKAFEAILDEYLGKNPQSFQLNGKNYTPKSFANTLNIDPEDYIELTSYSLYPFFEKIELDIPDNWNNGKYYNIPLKEFMDIILYSLKNGYTLVWDGDISNYSFSSRIGIANEPVHPWNEDMDCDVYSYIKTSRKELKIDQNIRDKEFINQNVIDNHLMHLIGFAKDQKDTLFFKVKDSLGNERNDFGGFIYMSEEYVKKNTVAIMVHKNALPKSLKTLLGIN